MKKALLFLVLFTLLGLTSAWAYDFSAVAPTGQTLYYDITSSTSPYTVSVTYPSSSGTSTWSGYPQPTGSLTIPSTVTYSGRTYTVTAIGNYAFYGCSGLTSVTIPNSVTSIGNRAFFGCSGLTSVTIPNSVTSIGSSAFRDCSGLTSVTIPNSVTSIESSAFYDCSGLTSVTIPNSVTSIGYYAFYSCSGLTSVTIPNSVTSIGQGAFSGCSGLTSLVVETGNTVYDSRDNCNAIIETATNTLISGTKNTVIPNSVTAIGNDAFDGCSGLTSVTIPNSVTSIESSAFYDCSGLTSVTIPNSVTSIGYYAFYSCSGLTSVTIPNSVTSIGQGAFSGCSGLTSLVVETGNTVYDSRDNCNAIIETATNTLISGTKNTVIPNSVTAIGNDAFDGCSGLTSVTIPNSVTSIESSAFYDCSGLTSVTIPNSVTFIGSAAFSGCSGLTSVTIPNSVTSIESSAFGSCSGLTSVNYLGTVAEWCGISFGNRSSNPTYYAHTLSFNGTPMGSTLTIPNSVTFIGSAAFSGCSGLTSVTIPNSVTSIGSYAFQNCSSLTNIISKASTAPTLGPDAFSNVPTNIPIQIPCGSLASYQSRWWNFSNLVEVGCYFNAVASTGQTLYYHIISTTDNIVEVICPSGSYWSGYTQPTGALTIPSTVTYSGTGTTYSVTAIGDNAFYGCSALTRVSIPNSVTAIGNLAFGGCSGLTIVTIPNSVTAIGDWAFEGCSGLTSLTIGNSVTSIGEAAFYGCSGLTIVTIPNSVTAIGNEAFEGCSGLTSVTIPNSVTAIGDHAFDYCSGLTSVTIPNSVTSIGSAAFRDCSGLTSVTIPNSVTSMGVDAFYGCSGLTSVTIPNSVTAMGNSAFQSCTSLSHVTFNARNCSDPTSSSNRPFIGCTNINSVTIGDSVQRIPAYLFYGCSGLTSVTIGNSVTAIGDEAFDGCSGLTNITIPNSVTAIGNWAFWGCSGLTGIISKASPAPTLGTEVFVGVATNIPVYIPCGSRSSYQSSWSGFSNFVERFNFSVQAVSSDETMGSAAVTRQPTCTTPTAVVQATPASGYAFDHWSNGATQNPYTLTVTRDITLTAYFTTSCSPIRPQDLPYTENFDGYTTSTTAKTGTEPTCWTLAHRYVSMTAEYEPMIYYGASNAHSGSYSLLLNKRGIYAMPRYAGDVSTLRVSFYLRQSDTNYQLEVGVMSNLSSAGTFTPVTTLRNANTTNLAHYDVDLTGYVGDGRYIAFRNSLPAGVSGNFSCNYLDDVTLSVAPPHCEAITAADLPYTEDFDGYTTSTTDKTGVKPDCWTLAHQYVSMTAEYLPMIYYGASNAHSGSYSLLLNKRGIYAMPEYDGDVSTLQMSLYVRQSNDAYQLELGVMSDLDDESTFVPVATLNNATTTEVTQYTVDFSGYTGAGKYIAFRNTNGTSASSAFSCNYIDDVTLSVAPPHCEAITAAGLSYTEDFDGYTTSTTAKTGVEPDCWTLAHEYVTMTDEYKPMIYYGAANAHSGNYSLLLNKRGIYAMPEYEGEVSTLQMSLYVRQSNTAYQLEVGVMSDLDDESTFVPVATLNNATTTEVTQYIVDFNGYTGAGKYIAFRNTNGTSASSAFSCNYIDDVTLSVAPPHCEAITAADLPYTENFDGYTTSTTAKTGVEPDCWTLAHEYVSMTDEYRPMIYYGATSAHSGSYSLLLNKRGIYAMPEYEGEVSTLQMSLYVRQSNTAYQLEVGVMSDLDDESTFVPVATLNNATTTEVTQYTVDFSGYTGAGKYIAFRNTNGTSASSAFSCNYIDDVTLSVAPPHCEAITAAGLPYTEDFDGYTTSTTAKTGVEPDCWTLAHEYVSMTDEYRPMIYYGATSAHSGSYTCC